MLVCPLAGTAGEGVKLQDGEGLGYFRLLSSYFKSFCSDRAGEKPELEVLYRNCTLGFTRSFLCMQHKHTRSSLQFAAHVA